VCGGAAARLPALSRPAARGLLRGRERESAREGAKTWGNLVSLGLGGAHVDFSQLTCALYPRYRLRPSAAVPQAATTFAARARSVRMRQSRSHCRAVRRSSAIGTEVIDADNTLRPPGRGAAKVEGDVEFALLFDTICSQYRSGNSCKRGSSHRHRHSMPPATPCADLRCGRNARRWTGSTAAAVAVDIQL